MGTRCQAVRFLALFAERTAGFAGSGVLALPWPLLACAFHPGSLPFPLRFCGWCVRATGGGDGVACFLGTGGVMRRRAVLVGFY